MEYVVDTTSLGILVVISASIGMLIGLGAALLLRGNSNPGKLPRKGLVEVARIWRVKTDGRLLMQIDDETVEEMEALQTEQQLALQRMAADLAVWAKVFPATVPAQSGLADAPVSPPPAVMPAGPVPSYGAQEKLAAADVSTPSLPEIRQSSAPIRLPPQPAVVPSGELQPPSLNPIKSLLYTLESEAKVERKPMSLVEQIDEILQKNLRGTTLEQRGVRLMELPAKGMMVLVGLDQYERVQDVPDEDVRAAIRSAVKEWERTNSQ